MSQSLRNSFAGEAYQHVLTASLLLSMLPDGWDCSGEYGHAIQSDGLYLRSPPHGNQNGDGERLWIIRANRSIKICALIPIVNSMRHELQQDGNSDDPTILSPPTFSRQVSDIDYVYYFEIFILSGVFSVGFDTASGEEATRNRVDYCPGYAPESIGLNVNGDLWFAGTVISGWTEPFQNGDTIGCGVVVGSNAKYFFTRNGDVIDGGDVDCCLSSTNIALAPCLGVSSSAETIIRTNFGLDSEHRFVWKGNDKTQIICRVTTRSSSNLNPINDTDHSGEALLPPGLFRGHTISCDSTEDHPAVIYTEEKESNGDDFGPEQITQLVRRHSDQMLGQGLETPGDRFFTHPPFSQAVAQIKALDLNDIKELARELRSATSASDAHHGAFYSLVDVCRTNLDELNETVQHATMGINSVEHDLGELLAVHEIVTDAIEAAEKKKTEIESNDKKMSERRDIFSHLCHLRSQKHKRYDAAWGLLRLTKRGTEEEICHEIIAASGMKSLLTLFEQSSDSTELMMVSSLTAVYLLPSFLDSGAQSSASTMGIIECLQFLIQSSKEGTNFGISSYEIRTASAFAMTNLWFKVLATKLRSTENALENHTIKRSVTYGSNQDILSGRQRFRRRRSSLSSQTNEEFNNSILVDAYTSLSVMAAKSEASMKDEEGQTFDMNVYYEFALIVESICAVEYAMPMVMKEGVIPLLLQWLSSGDCELERPAANALRNLTSTKDEYMAGWIHSQLLNDLSSIVGRLASADSRVRLAMAQAVSSLTVAPHTRAGIIEARGVKYLSQLLGSIDVQSRDEALAIAAGNALLQLAVGATSRSGRVSESFARKSWTPLKKESIIDDIIQNGALNSLVSMARAENYGCLRFLSVKLLCVISEECKGHAEGIERQLCDAEAVSALGKILCRHVTFICSAAANGLASSDTSHLFSDPLRNGFSTSTDDAEKNVLNEVQHVLRTLVNILQSVSLAEDFSEKTAFSDTPLRACSQLITSGGVKSLLWISSMSCEASSKPEIFQDIQLNSYQILAFLSPLVLSPDGLTLGTNKWAPSVLSALVMVLKKQKLDNILSSSSGGISPDICVDILQGIGRLANCEPLKTRIMDEFMPDLLEFQRHHNRNVSDAANQICLSLGFNEVESGVRDAYRLGDKFILSRSRIVEAMARDEIRRLLTEIWKPSLEVTDVEFSKNGHSELGSLFCHLCQDRDTAESRERLLHQFMNIYDCSSAPSTQHVRSMTSLGHNSHKAIIRTMHRSGSFANEVDYDSLQERVGIRGNSIAVPTPSVGDINLRDRAEIDGNETVVSTSDDNFLRCHQFPLNGWRVERDWVMRHCQSLTESRSVSTFSPHLPSRVNDLLRVCFPSNLIQDEVIPLCCFRPNASFNFRALAMPSGHYFSFRHEGQIVSQECQTIQPPERVHCVLCFRNSTFAGEFADSLLKALYLCPILQGLSFSNDAVADESAHEQEGSELLPFLVRAIPSSVTHLTFDNVLSNNAALSLSNILKGANSSLHALAVINSPHISQTNFASLVESINGLSAPLRFLRVLDLSGNLLGDFESAKVLSIALSHSSSSIAIERLDLSNNGIGEGNEVKRVLEDCVSNDPRLEALKLANNDFGEGVLASQLAASLGDVLAKLVSIDLSGNDLSDAFLAGLGGILLTNCQLVNLNISKNQFSTSSINSFLSRLQNMSKLNVSTQLSFVHLEGNVPPLASNQEMVLSDILSANRQRLVAAYLKERKSSSLQIESDSCTNTSSLTSDITREPNLDRKLPPAETIAVLFSAPLVWRDAENNYHPIEMLDFKLEKSLLWQCFSEASRNIDLSYDNATTGRLQAVLTRGFKCLHFSGHGHPYSLTFEDGSGGIHWFSVEQLKALISGGMDNGEAPFEFVFVSACHSALAGHTFVDCGVRHVVCCQQESQLMDRAALSFTRAFYLALAVGRTLKDSFEIGKHAVLSSATLLNPEEEMSKFMLLPENGNHDVPIFKADEVSEWPLNSMNSSKGDINDSLPTPPQGFFGREADLYHVLNLVLNRRLVNIVGQTGMGRSSLAAALCHYIDERKSTLLFDSIYFVRPMMKRQVAGKSSPIISLHDQLVSAGKVKAIIKDTDLDETIKEILAYLKQTKSLLVFDKTETHDETADAQDFHFFLGQIFERTKDVHVLITSHQSIGLSPLLNVGESVYKLGPFNLKNTVKLFAFHCPHLHSARERKALLEELASHAVMNPLAEDDEDLEKMKSMLGGGVPAKTFALAYEITADEFEALKSKGKEHQDGKEQVDAKEEDGIDSSAS